jgi:hypothetical protein
LIYLDVIHCVRDLKQILRNPLVIRHDNVQLTRRQRTFVPKRMVNNIILLTFIEKKAKLFLDLIDNWFVRFD